MLSPFDICAISSYIEQFLDTPMLNSFLCTRKNKSYAEHIKYVRHAVKNRGNEMKHHFGWHINMPARLTPLSYINNEARNDIYNMTAVGYTYEHIARWWTENNGLSLIIIGHHPKLGRVAYSMYASKRQSMSISLVIFDKNGRQYMKKVKDCFGAIQNTHDVHGTSAPTFHI